MSSDTFVTYVPGCSRMRWAIYDAIVNKTQVYAGYSRAKALDTMTRFLARAR
jgi:hypothetical protein